MMAKNINTKMSTMMEMVSERWTVSVCEEEEEEEQLRQPVKRVRRRSAAVGSGAARLLPLPPPPLSPKQEAKVYLLSPSCFSTWFKLSSLRLPQQRNLNYPSKCNVLNLRTSVRFEENTQRRKTSRT
ncbi:hypothetical protein F2P81_015363 [Scophthalmus maximus]|uniref:Uncharacterized protein n=1 Tax=Scophthalmus maximus TaxID=52904 RepID=A0A6A4SG14_SCOMX|nr:hypothetical protein F2P81_015363 [Scophthalmus maximus]